jgi:uncharacterized protein YjbI with pentapeptide repeats
MSCPHHRAGIALQKLGIPKETAELLQAYASAVELPKDWEEELGNRSQRLKAFLNMMLYYREEIDAARLLDNTEATKQNLEAFARLYETIVQYLDGGSVSEDTRAKLQAVLSIADGTPPNIMPEPFNTILVDSYLASLQSSDEPFHQVAKTVWAAHMTDALVRHVQNQITDMVAVPVRGISPGDLARLANGDTPSSVFVAARDIECQFVPAALGVVAVLPVDDGKQLHDLIIQGSGSLFSSAPLIAAVAPPYEEVIDACAQVAQKDPGMPRWFEAWQHPTWLEGDTGQGEQKLGKQRKRSLWDHIGQCIAQRDWTGLYACFGIPDTPNARTFPVPNMVAGAALAYRRAVDQGALSPQEARQQFMEIIDTVARVWLLDPAGQPDDAQPDDAQPDDASTTYKWYGETHLPDMIAGFAIPWPGDPDAIVNAPPRVRMEAHLKDLLIRTAQRDDPNDAAGKTTVNYLGLAPLILDNPVVLDGAEYPSTPDGERAWQLAHDCLRNVLAGPPAANVQHELSPITAATTVALLNYIALTDPDPDLTRYRIFSGIAFPTLVADDGSPIGMWWQSSREVASVRYLPSDMDVTGASLVGLSVEYPIRGLSGNDANLVSCTFREDITGSTFNHAWFHQPTLSERRISRTTMEGAVVADGIGSRTVLDGVTGTKSLWYEGMYRDATITQSNFDQAAFVGGEWVNTQFSDTSMNDVLAVRTNFSNTQWHNTSIAGARFQQCTFDDADLSGVSGWETADVTGSSFAMARLPSGIRGTTIATEEVSIPVSLSEGTQRQTMGVTMVIANPDAVTDEVVQIAKNFPFDRFRRLAQQGRTPSTVTSGDADYDEVIQLHDQLNRMTAAIKIYNSKYKGDTSSIANVYGVYDMVPARSPDQWGKAVFNDAYYRLVETARQLVLNFHQSRSRPSIEQALRDRFLPDLISATKRRVNAIPDSGRNPWSWAHLDLINQIFMNGRGPVGLLGRVPPFISALPKDPTNPTEDPDDQPTLDDIERLTSLLFTPRPKETNTSS